MTTLTQQERQSAVQQYVVARLATGMVQNKLATELGISPAHLINVREGKWTSVSDEVVNRIFAYAKINTKWRILETPNYKAITELCTDCMENNHFRAIAGFTGGGKTVALRSFADRHPNAAYVEANILMNRKSFLSAICRAFGMHIDDTAEGLMNKIVDRMISEEQTVLLIDDAAKLKDDCFRLLQVIYDKTEGSAGIVIAGTEKLKKYLDRSAAKDKLSYRELKRRISFWQSLKKPTAVVIKKVAEVYEIVDKDVIQWLSKEVQDYGTLRNYILNALKVAVVGSNVSVAILNDLHLGDRAYRD